MRRIQACLALLLTSYHYLVVKVLPQERAAFYQPFFLSSRPQRDQIADAFFLLTSACQAMAFLCCRGIYGFERSADFGARSTTLGKEQFYMILPGLSRAIFFCAGYALVCVVKFLRVLRRLPIICTPLVMSRAIHHQFQFFNLIPASPPAPAAVYSGRHIPGRRPSAARVPTASPAHPAA